MNYITEVMFEKDNYALILRGNKYNEYAVVYGLDKEKKEWVHTVGYYTVFHAEEEPDCLAKALDLYRAKTDKNYISRSRLEEIATKFKDRLSELNCELDEDAEYGTFDYDTLVFMAEELELTDVECDYFGIDKNQFRHNDLEIQEV